VEIVRRSFDAFARDGFVNVPHYFDSAIEWTTTDAFLEADTYRGVGRPTTLLRHVRG